MSMTLGEKQELQKVLKRVINTKLVALKGTHIYRETAKETAKELEKTYFPEEINILREKYDKSVTSLERAKVRKDNAERAFDKAVYDFIAAEDKAGTQYAADWEAANGRRTWGSCTLTNMNRHGVLTLLEHLGEKAAGNLPEFKQIAELESLKNNLDMVILTSRSSVALNKVVRGLYAKYAKAEDATAIEVMEELFPFLFIDED